MNSLLHNATSTVLSKEQPSSYCQSVRQQRVEYDFHQTCKCSRTELHGLRSKHQMILRARMVLALVYGNHGPIRVRYSKIHISWTTMKTSDLAQRLGLSSEPENFRMLFQAALSFNHTDILEGLEKPSLWCWRMYSLVPLVF